MDIIFRAGSIARRHDGWLCSERSSMSNTAIRRFHDRRMKKKVVKLYGYPWAFKYADHACACSCWMCGHTRKNFGAPISDLRQSDVDYIGVAV